MEWLWWRISFVIVQVFEANSFSKGAPDSSCDDMSPRHGFEPQTSISPAEIVVDQYTVSHGQYLRVTLRSKTQPFKGFIIQAVDILDSRNKTFGSFSSIGTWHIPYTEDSQAGGSQYLHCGGVQTAVTHSGVTISMWRISLQWKPPDQYHGLVTITATIVRDYITYWTGIESTPVHVVSQEDEDTEEEDDNMYIDSDALFGDIMKERDKQKYKTKPKSVLPSKVTTISRYNDSKTKTSFKLKVNGNSASPDSKPSASLEEPVSHSHYLTEHREKFRSTKADNVGKAVTENTDKVLGDKTIELNTAIFVTAVAVRKSRTNLEDSYSRLETPHGSWKNSGAGVAHLNLLENVKILLILGVFLKVMYRI